MIFYGVYQLSSIFPSVGVAIFKDRDGANYRQIINSDHRIEYFLPVEDSLALNRVIAIGSGVKNSAIKQGDFAIYCIVTGAETAQVGTFIAIKTFFMLLNEDDELVRSHPFFALELAGFVGDEEIEVRAAGECIATLARFGADIRDRWLDSVKNESFFQKIPKNDNLPDELDQDNLDKTLALGGSIQTLVSMTRYAKNKLRSNRSVEISIITKEKLSNPKFQFDANWFYEFLVRYGRSIVRKNDHMIALEYFNVANSRTVVSRKEYSAIYAASLSVLPSLLSLGELKFSEAQLVGQPFLSSPGRRRTTVLFVEFSKKYPDFVEYYFNNPIERYYGDDYHRTVTSLGDAPLKRDLILRLEMTR